LTICYSRACGPRALAAIANRSEYVLAEELLALQRARGRVTVPGTVDNDMFTWLVRRGFSVEPWSLTTDAPELPAAEFAERIRREPPGQVETRTLAERITAALPEWPREEVEAEVAKHLAALPRVIEWIAAHPIGTWLVHVDAHYLAFRDGRVIAGDFADLRQYAAHRVLRVERINR
jgi:hypothetical protein